LGEIGENLVVNGLRKPVEDHEAGGVTPGGGGLGDEIFRQNILKINDLHW
jgi:hypothetical protein